MEQQIKKIPVPVNKEKWKHDYIYSHQETGPQVYQTYGHTNHGKHMAKKLSAASSLLDVGCGFNEFVHRLRDLSPNGYYVGMDFSCPGADINYDVCSPSGLPFIRETFEYVTAFDVLEHLRHEQLEQAIVNMREVSFKFCYSVSTVPSRITVQGQNLHPIVRDFEWWKRKLCEYADKVEWENGYFIGDWSKEV